MANKGKTPTPKTQREISISQHQAYDTTRGNPNVVDPTNRAEELSFKGDTTKPFSVGLEDIDGAIIYYFENIIRPTVIQNGTRIPVPIVYGSPERWKAVQKDGFYRDKKGKIMMPLIVFKRTNIEKNRSIANKLDANNPNNYKVFTKAYSPKNAYDKFNILNNRKPQKQYYAVVMPDYVTLTYECIVSTYYVEQMNKIIEAINYASDSYWGNPEQFKFQARIDSFANTTELPQGEQRVVKTNFSLRLYGYIIPDTTNKELSAQNKFSDKTKVVFNFETQIGPDSTLPNF
jgi:hypothetical protein